MSTHVPVVEAAIETGSGSTRVKDYFLGFAFVCFLTLLGLVYGDLRGRQLEGEARERDRDRTVQVMKDGLMDKLSAQREESARRWQQIDDVSKDMHEMKSDIHDIKVELQRGRKP